MNKWILYAHVNKLNKKCYIGITSKKNPNHRWNNGKGYKQNPYFYNAILKYGWDGFEHYILLTNLTRPEAIEFEQSFIMLLKTQNRERGYNMTAGGDGTRGYHPSLETRMKLSELGRKENLSLETRQKRSESLRKRKLTKEHKDKIGKANSKAIDMFDRSGIYLNSFTSAQEAEMKTGISHSHISQCCHNKRRTSGVICGNLHYNLK